jgi:hypothetical protein
VIYDAITTSDLRKVRIDGGESVRLTDLANVFSPNGSTLTGSGDIRVTFTPTP